MFTEKNVSAFEESAMQIVESLRMAEEINQNLKKSLLDALTKLSQESRGCNDIPKSLAFAFQVLKDNMDGALLSLKGERRETIAEINSKANSLIEDILLN